MLLPKDHPVYREDGTPFKAKMIAWIRVRYGAILGDDVAELEREGGLDRLAEKIRARVREMTAATSLRPD